MRTISIFCLMILILASCGGKKDKQISDHIVGKWQPEKLELKGIPVYLKSQINEKDIQDKLFDNDRKTGWMELKADSTFILKETKSHDGITGKWSFDGKTLRLGAEELPFSFYVETLDNNKLEVDYASAYKAMAGVDNLPFLGKIKMIVTYKKIN